MNNDVPPEDASKRRHSLPSNLDELRERLARYRAKLTDQCTHSERGPILAEIEILQRALIRDPRDD